MRRTVRVTASGLYELGPLVIIWYVGVAAIVAIIVRHLRNRQAAIKTSIIRVKRASGIAIGRRSASPA